MLRGEVWRTPPPVEISPVSFPFFLFTWTVDKKRVRAKKRVLCGFRTLFFPAYNIVYTLSILRIRCFIRYSQRC
jgi:hypothetical protein